MKYTIPAGSTEVEIPDPLVSQPPPIFSFPPVNIPPDVNAGNDITITLPVNSVQLVGNAKDPDGSIRSVEWTQLTGTSGSIQTPTQQSTLVTDLKEGTNTFQFRAFDDKGAEKKDTVVVTVLPAASVPVQSIYGYGSRAQGGGGKQVINVDAANFRSSIGSNRILRFTGNARIQGGIKLTGVSYLTIDANGFDVVIENGSYDNFSIGSGSHHIIVKGLVSQNAANDCFNVIEGATDIAFIRCAALNGKDGGMDLAGGRYITAQECFIGNCQSNRAMLNTAGPCTIFRCVFYNNKECVMIHSNYTPVLSPNAEVLNCAFINWGSRNGTDYGYAVEVSYKSLANIKNNYFVRLANTAGEWNAQNATVLLQDYSLSGTSGFAHISGNVSGNGVDVNKLSNRTEIALKDHQGNLADWAKVPVKEARTAADEVIKLPFVNPTVTSLLKNISLK